MIIRLVLPAKRKPRELTIPVGDRELVNIEACVVAKSFPTEVASWDTISPRKATRNSTYRKVMRTLRDNPELMPLRSNGISLAVDSATYDKGSIYCELISRRNRGVFDGLHGLLGITDTIAAADEHPDDFAAFLEYGLIPVHIWVAPTLEEIRAMAVSKNNDRVAQRRDSLINYNNGFSPIKMAFSGHRGADTICYRAGEEGPVAVGNILRHLLPFSRTLFPITGEEQPEPYYLGAPRNGKALHMWESLIATQPRDEITQLANFAPAVMEMRDMINYDMRNLWKSKAASNEGKNDRLMGTVFRRKAGGNAIKVVEKAQLNFLGNNGRVAEVELPAEIMHLILSSLRVAVDCEGEHMDWVKQAGRLWKTVQLPLMKAVKRYNTQAESLKDLCNSATYAMCRDTVAKALELSPASV